MPDLSEGLFDGVEVGRIGRQEPEPCAGAADRLADRSSLVASEVVEDNDVARLQGGNEDLLDPGLEARGGPSKTQGAVSPSERGEEGQGAPVAPLRRLSLSARPRHVGLDPVRRLARPSATVRLTIHEHQTVRLELPLATTPACGRLRLLQGEQNFLPEAQPLTPEKPPDRVAAHRDPPGRKEILQSIDRGVLPIIPQIRSR